MSYSIHRKVTLPNGTERLAVLDVTQLDQNHYYINRILVPEPVRCQGIGTDMLLELLLRVPSGAVIEVHPTTNYGSDLTRLTAFFALHGFKGTGLMQCRA
jgi:predicted GNAT family acetyltransferase